MDRKTLIAFFLIAIIMILYPWYMDILAPVQPALGPDSIAVIQPERGRVQTKAVQPTEKIQEPIDRPVSTVKEKIVTISSDLYTAKVSSRNGGSFVSFSLLEYDKFDTTKVNLVYEHNQENLLLEFVSIDGDLIRLDASWILETSRKSLNVTRESQTIVFSTTVNGKKITKSLTFHPGTYTVDIDLDFSAMREVVSQGKYTLRWDGGLPSTEKITKDEYAYFKGAAYLGGELLKLENIKNGDTVVEEQSGNTNWISTQNKYFIAAIIPSQAGLGGKVSGRKIGNHPIYDVSLAQDIRSKNSYRLYLGPLEYTHITGLGVELEKTMNLGWTPLRPVGRLITWTLRTLHKAIPNYGVVLIVFSVLLKILLNPLTKKSYQSTRRMQDLQPKIAKLKEKYKNDAQKMNKAQMALFKEEGVNPMGGCLPMLLQMPVLISLFAVFRSTIEFRGAPFIWWITDLSSPDIVFYLPFSIPLYGSHVAILPIIMGITMFLQQKLMSPGGGSQQKMMGYFMTGFFLLLFNSFPSGLNLYYTVFNALTIVQQKYLTPAQSPKKQTLPAVKTKQKK